MSNDTVIYFLIGGGIGLVCAIIGAFVDYSVGRKRGDVENDGRPGCMFIAAGGLGFVGLIAFLLSFVITGTVGPAFMMGLGVTSGFFIGFAVLFIGAILLLGKGD